MTLLLSLMPILKDYCFANITELFEHLVIIGHVFFHFDYGLYSCVHRNQNCSLNSKIKIIDMYIGKAIIYRSINNQNDKLYRFFL